MAPIHGLFHEIRFEILKVAILNAFLDATILFLALLLVLSVFSMSLLWPLLAALLFFGFSLWRYGRRLSLRYIEERNPSVREMLRTAADNKGEDTLMAHALFAELIEKVRTVSSGTFLDFRRLFLKIGAVFVLSVVLVSLAFFNVNIQKFANPLASLEGSITGYWGGLVSPNMTKPNISEGGDIYGEPSLAKLGDQAIGITLQQNLNQIDFNKVSQADQAGSVPDNYPVGDVAAKASQAYTGGLQDVNDRKTAADYSQEIKK